MGTLESHPADDPKFNQFHHPTVWYMAHPLASDESYTRERNMEHVLHMVRLFFSEGIRVVAPYHTIMLVLDDHNPDHRRIGLETDLAVVEKLGRVILCGHKISRGMRFELEASRGPYVSLVGKKDSEVREWCRQELVEEREFLRSATDDMKRDMFGQ